jgi:Asp-tRNA(Asn)/Glu-tRNA(Gln) amidotransferase A subunit family amidase
VLLLPVAATPAFPIVDGPQPDRSRLDVCTRAVTLLRLPAVVVPCATASGGLPIGVQVVAAEGQDTTALAVAAVLEETFGRWVPGRKEAK